MKLLVVATALCLGAVSSVPMGAPGQITPAMRTMMLDMVKNMFSTMHQQRGPPPPPPNTGYVPAAHMPPPMMPPQNPRFAPPMNSHNSRAPSNSNNGLFMELPTGHGGYGTGMGMMPTEYCPPTGGPPSMLNDACKDQILREALYFSNGKPRYKWVTPLNPWDPSISDNLKDVAKNILYSKVRNRAPTPKEAELMSILGDAPGHMGARMRG